VCVYLIVFYAMHSIETHTHTHTTRYYPLLTPNSTNPLTYTHTHSHTLTPTHPPTHTHTHTQHSKQGVTTPLPGTQTSLSVAFATSAIEVQLASSKNARLKLTLFKDSATRLAESAADEACVIFILAFVRALTDSWAARAKNYKYRRDV